MSESPSPLAPSVPPGWERLRANLRWYLFAVVTTVVAWAAAWFLAERVPSGVMIVLWLLPMTASAHLGGIGPGLVAMILSALGLFMMPAVAPRTVDPLRPIEMILIIGFGLLMTATARWSWRSRQLAAHVANESSLLKSVLASSSDGILAVDTRGRVLQLNRRFAELWRLPPELVHMGEDTALLHHCAAQAAEPEIFVRRIRELLPTPDEARDEVRLRDGRWFERTSAPLRDGDAIVGRVWSFRDATERKRTEAQRQKEADTSRLLVQLYNSAPTLSEQQLLELAIDRAAQLTESDVGFVLRVGNDRVTFSPVAFTERLRSEGRRILDASPASRLAAWTECVRERRPLRTEIAEPLAAAEPALTLQRALLVPVITGPMVPLIFCVGNKATPYGADDQSRLELLAAELGEISTRLKAERTLAETRRWLEHSQRISAVGGWIIEVKTGRVWSSPEACRIYGFTEKDGPFPLAVIQSIPLPGFRPMLDRAFTQLVEHGNPYDLEFQIMRPSDGAVRDVHSRAEYIAADGIVLGVIHDVTDQKRAERSLRASEQRFRALFDDSPSGIVEMDFSTVRRQLDRLRKAGRDLRTHLATHPHGVRRLAAQVRIVLANRRSLEILHVASAAELPAKLLEYFSADTLDTFQEQVLRLDHSARPEPIELPLVDPAGNTTRIELTLAIQPGCESNWRRIVATFRDVTDRARAEAERRTLARAVEQSPVTVIITDPAGRIEYVNPQFATATGYTMAEVVGCNPRILKSNAHPDAIYRELWSTITSGREWRGELCNRRKDGTLFWEEASIAPVLDDAGKIAHYIAVKEDITDRRRAEERLRDHAALLDEAQDAIFALDLERRVTFANRAAGKLYGFDTAAAAGRRYEDLVYRRAPSNIDIVWQTLLETGSSLTERQHQRPNGDDMIVQIRASLMYDDAGRPRAALLVLTDITETKRFEAHFLRAQRMDSLGVLAGGVAHDLNNVFTPVMLSLGTLRDLAHTPHDREMLQLLNDGVRRGAEIVRQLLVFGRGTDAAHRPVNIRHLVRELQRMVQETFPKNLTIAMHAPPDLWTVQGDFTQLHQVLLNLCVNARDAMPQGGTLEVAAENVHLDEAFVRAQFAGQVGRHVRVRVTDTGGGIPPEIIDKIFDPFFTTKPVGRGTGLGLSTVLSITQSHGGFVTVQSTVGHGTRFEVYLPSPSTPTEAASPAESDTVRPGQGELVLLADDEAAIRIVLERRLQQAGYKVLTAAEGRGAAALFRRHANAIRLLVTDIAMPVQDGLETIRQVRAANPTLPVIAMSGFSQHRAELAQLPPPAIHFVDKPFTTEAILTVIRRTLDTARSNGESRLRQLE